MDASFGISMVGTPKGLGMFNVVGRNELRGFFDKSFGLGNGMEGRET